MKNLEKVTLFVKPWEVVDSEESKKKNLKTPFIKAIKMKGSSNPKRNIYYADDESYPNQLF